NAGIIPDSVMQSVDMENMNLTMSQMVSTFVSLDSLGALTVGTPEKENNISGVSGSKDGWGSWDGQAHTIDGTNCKGAQWRLILDWIELICEYTDDTSIHSIALRLVDGFVRARVDDPDIKTRMLLRSASFFEVGKIRDVFALALIEYAAALWKEQASGLDDISDSASGLLFVSDAMSSISGTFPSKGIAKKPAAQDPIAMVAARLPEENQAQLHVLTSDQVRVWTRLMRAVVQFPVAYWTSLDAASFEATLVTTIRLAQKFGQSTATVASTMFTAYMHAGYRQAGGDSDPAEKRKAVQKRLGSALTALHAALHAHPSVESALHVLGAIDELLLEPTMRFTTYDISEVLSNLVRYHTSRVLDVISLLVKVLRSLMHAFVLPAIPRRLTAVERLGIDAGSTPWIVAYAPFNARCAESYARVLDDLVRSRRSTAGFTSSRKEMSSNSGSTRLKADISGFVKLTRGTNAASTAYVVGLFAPYILAEYCIIQGGGAQSAISLRALGRGGADNASGGNSFYGFGWRPTPVLAGMQDRSNVLPCDTLETNVSANSSGRRGVISSMAVREALLPGLHALLDVMGDDNRNTLLAQLAGPSNDTRQGLATNWSSLFGPDRYGGASEILKSLYKSYLDFYKYSGQV
ncbi:hypothetical protein EV177_003351, partial [Coemansia sp. RSA 1804]